MFKLYKQLGETPLAAITRLRQEKPELEGEKLSYAGRLDPMAEGLLLILVGDENKNREAYLGLDKEYEAKFIFGLETDTHDVLGLVKMEKELADSERSIVSRELAEGGEPSEDDVQRAIGNLKGKWIMTYPWFSSKTVDGKPLYYWARKKFADRDSDEGIDDEVDIVRPEKVVEIYESDLVERTSLKKAELSAAIIDKLSRVSGNFRQQKILERWEEYFSMSERTVYNVYSVRIVCSSGTYIRALADRLGRELECGGILFDLKRTRIGNDSVEERFENYVMNIR